MAARTREMSRSLLEVHPSSNAPGCERHSVTTLSMLSAGGGFAACHSEVMAIVPSPHRRRGVDCRGAGTSRCRI
jgi:hypothetical protein